MCDMFWTLSCEVHSLPTFFKKKKIKSDLNSMLKCQASLCWVKRLCPLGKKKKSTDFAFKKIKSDQSEQGLLEEALVHVSLFLSGTRALQHLHTTGGFQVDAQDEVAAQTASLHIFRKHI